MLHPSIARRATRSPLCCAALIIALSACQSPPDPQTSAPTPDMDAPAPDRGVATPDRGAPTPDMDAPTPDMDAPTPDMDAPAPDMDAPCTLPPTNACADGDVWRLDACGQREELIQDCGPRELCEETDSGATCVRDLRCAANADCAPEEHCAAGVCAPDVCVPGAASCADDGLSYDTCDAAGADLLTTLCAGGRRCDDADGSPSCVCVPSFSQACYNGDVYSYDSCGVRGALVTDCRAPELCRVINEVATCALPATCTSNTQCYANQWCDVAAGVCRDDVCVPGAASCADDGLSYDTCDAAGADLLTTLCAGGRRCDDADGSPSCVCVPNFSQACSNNDVYSYDSCGVRGALLSDCRLPELCRAVVSEDGASALSCALPEVCTVDTHCYANQWCDVASGECRADSCAGSSDRYCDGVAIMSCASNGSGYSTLLCTGGQSCVEGTTGPSCRCIANAYRACSTGDVWNFNSCNTRNTIAENCTGANECIEGPLGPYCGPRLTCLSDYSCAEGYYCSAGLCVPRACEPNALRCDGALLYGCTARGDAEVLLEECAGGEVCVEGASGVAACECVPDAALGCSGPDVWSYDSCGNRLALAASCPLNAPCQPTAGGAACTPPAPCASDASCAATARCEDGVCVPDACPQGQRFCEGASVRECDARGAESSLVTECATGQRCELVSGAPTCVCAPNVGSTCGADGNVYALDSCGRVGLLTQTCAATQDCVAVGGSASCVDAGCGASCGGACTPDSYTACYAGDLYRFTSCDQPQEAAEVCRGQISCNSVGGPAACRSSLSRPEAPGYELSCGLVQQLTFPTSGDYDCRCTSNRDTINGVPRCIGAQYLEAATRFGSGPSVRALPQGHLNGGFIAGDELVVGVDWSSSTNPDAGLVMRVNLNTGDRAVVSGQYQDPRDGVVTVGAGPRLFNVMDVEDGPDGSYYALSVPTESYRLEIVRVNPQTGDRALVWRGSDPTFAHCESGDPQRPNGVQVHERGFEVDAQGRFLLAFRNTSPNGEGVGVIRIGAQGNSCEFITRSGSLGANAYAGAPVGEGFVVDRGYYAGFELLNGRLYALSDGFKAVIEVDLATGRRARVSSASTSTGVLGSGPVNVEGMGNRWLTWDATRNIMWSTGRYSVRQMIAVDLPTGDRVEAFCRASNPDAPWRNLCLSGVMAGGYQGEGGFWVHPSGRIFAVHENFTLVEVDILNGNSWRVSL